MLKMFVIRERQHLLNAIRFLEQNWEAMSKTKHPLQVECSEENKKRNVQQNKYYWKAVLQQIERDAWVEGQQYSAEVWHEAAKRKFIGCVDLPGGGRMGISTTTLGVNEFAEYVNKVEAWAAMELGVTFETNMEPTGRSIA